MRILHISDLHLTPNQSDKIAWVRALGALNPHLVVNTGDNMAHREGLPALLQALEPLLAVPGVFAMGSNDYHAPVPKNPARYLFPDSRERESVDPPELPWREMALAMTGSGWQDMTNCRAVLDLPQVHLEFVGVDDAHLDLDRFPLPKALPGPTAAVPTLRLGVTHAPYTRVLNRMVDDGCDLILTGHTHGGQLCLPGFGALVTNCDLNRGRAKGLHGWPGPRPDEFGGQDSSWLHVSAGLGTSPYAPVRFACRPEATLLTLTTRP